MDPKQNSNQSLDPKLKEVYDRVMGVNLAGQTTTDPQVAPAPAAQPSPAPSSDPLSTDSGLTAQAVPNVVPPSPTIDLNTPNPTPVVSTDTPVMPPAPALSTDPLQPSLGQTGSLTPPTDSPLTSSMMPPVPADVNAAVTAAAPTIPPPSDTPPPSPTSPSGGTMPVTPTMPPLSMPGTTPPVPQSGLGDPLTSQPKTDVMSSPVKMDSMSATLNIPQHHTTETVKIGIGGSPVGVTAHPKKKGVSPAIFIFGALAFLVVYAVFWVKFFGYTVPFLPK